MLLAYQAALVRKRLGVIRHIGQQHHVRMIPEAHLLKKLRFLERIITTHAAVQHLDLAARRSIQISFQLFDERVFDFDSVSECYGIAENENTVRILRLLKRVLVVTQSMGINADGISEA